MKTAAGPTLAEIQAARERVHGLARETPVYSSETLGRRSGRQVFLKAENLQRTGSFKICRLQLVVGFLLQTFAIIKGNVIPALIVLTATIALAWA